MFLFGKNKTRGAHPFQTKHKKTMSENQLANIGVQIFMDDNSFSRALKLAEMMATAKTIPKHLAGSPGDCLRVVELAWRTNQSAFALADKTFFIGGKMAFEGQLCAALLNASPILKTRLDYEYSGEGEDLTCVVSATIKGEELPRSIVVKWADGHTQSPGNKDLWKRQPEQQLSYWGARVWARRHTPEILLGIYTPEEIEVETMRDVTPRAQSDKPLLPPPIDDSPPPPLKEEAEDDDFQCFTEEHDALLEALESSDIRPVDFLDWVNATGKNTPDGGYRNIHELSVEAVTACLKNWDATAKKAQLWISNAP